MLFCVHVLEYHFKITLQSSFIIQKYACTYITTTVAGIVSDIRVPEVSEGGSVVSWSSPVPPNGVILHYNIRISRIDTGELVVFIEGFDGRQLDVTQYNSIERHEAYVLEVRSAYM